MRPDTQLLGARDQGLREQHILGGDADRLEHGDVGARLAGDGKDAAREQRTDLAGDASALERAGSNGISGRRALEAAVEMSAKTRARAISASSASRAWGDWRRRG